MTVKVKGIEVKEGYLVKLSYMPGVANLDEREAFHRVVRTNKNRSTIHVEMPKRIEDNCKFLEAIKEDLSGKRYFHVHTDYIIGVKGYFSLSEKSNDG